MALSRKHFISIAEILAKTEANQNTIDALCYFLKKENSAFNNERFINHIDAVKTLNLKKNEQKQK